MSELIFEFQGVTKAADFISAVNAYKVCIDRMLDEKSIDEKTAEALMDQLRKAANEFVLGDE